MDEELRRVATVAANYLDEIDQRIDPDTLGTLPTAASIAMRLRNAMSESEPQLYT
jgi:hypothetical protein